ncbi:MAG: ORF6N domain-containing protein [Clostridiales bacterium]|nr:ORF6N domain-containing protein [Clostridiales bacterium]
MANDNKLIIVDESTLKDKIYTIRGQQVMLDYDLAEIYGYETRYLNLQVKHNINRFPDDFMFQLTQDEFDNLMLKNSTSSHGGRRKPPYAFTEQGVYQLATVLKGELAERQSVAIMRVFRAMREYISQNKQLLPNQELFQLSARQAALEGQVRAIKDNMVSKADLSDFMKLFDQGIGNEEILILDGKPFKADEAYQKIYRSAKSKITIIDDYIGTKTLHHLAHSKKTVKITIISDNTARPRLRLTEYNDFVTENPGRSITFLQSMHRAHDRYIVLDEGTKDMKVYHCGASSKDAGKRITTITRIIDIDDYKATIKTMMGNPVLILR